jgi:ABC-type transporter MlaC component
MHRYLVAVIAFMIATSASAADVPADLQVKLQGAMLQHLDEIVVDGAYSYVDPKSQAVKTVYPANIHPMVVPFGADYFVCSEVIDEGGNNLTADFLVREVGGAYRVVQVLIDERQAMMAAMSKLGQ